MFFEQTINKTLSIGTLYLFRIIYLIYSIKTRTKKNVFPASGYQEPNRCIPASVYQRPYELIGDEHERGVGRNAEHVGHQPPIEPANSFSSEEHIQHTANNVKTCIP